MRLDQERKGGCDKFATFRQIYCPQAPFLDLAQGDFAFAIPVVAPIKVAQFANILRGVDA